MNESGKIQFSDPGVRRLLRTLILLLLALGFFGGTARQRPDALAPASSVPTPQTERQTICAVNSTK